MPSNANPQVRTPFPARPAKVPSADPSTSISTTRASVPPPPGSALAIAKPRPAPSAPITAVPARRGSQRPDAPRSTAPPSMAPSSASPARGWCQWGRKGMSRASRRLSPAVGNQCQYCSEGEEADQKDPGEHGGHRPQRQHDPPGGDVEGAAPLARRSHSDGDRRRVDEGQREQVEQQRDRYPLRDELPHRASEAEARAEVRALEEREAGEAVVLVEGEPGRRDAVEPAQVLERGGLVETVESVVVVLQRLLRLRLQVLTLDQGLGADAAR